jgi:two-component system OmpR family sensor kinase
MRVAVPLADIAREVVAELVPLADAKQIDLGISNSQPATVLGDPDALRTLTRNLVDNAVRYTPAGGRVDVSVENADPGAASGWGSGTEAGSSPRLDSGASPSRVPAASGPAHQPILKVVDDGPGIPAEERSRVLDRFYRRPGTSPPGSGLGMAIVKAIADAHDAKLELDTGPGDRGLAVCVRFPATTPLLRLT